MNLRLGKTWGLRRMADDAGHFTMVALDQRPPIANLVAAKRGIAPADVAFADMVAVKRLLVDVLGHGASAMLMDPNYAFPAALDRLPAHAGLVVTLEDHRFRDTPGGRLSHSIRDWSVEKIKRAGGDGVKVLAWYRPDAAPDVVAHQKDYVRRIGAELLRRESQERRTVPLGLATEVGPLLRAHRAAEPVLPALGLDVRLLAHHATDVERGAVGREHRSALDQEHPGAGLGEVVGGGRAACAGADDQVVVGVEHGSRRPHPPVRNSGYNVMPPST